MNPRYTHQHFPAVTSTNDVARKLALSGAEEGTVVTTDDQTAGRGRLGRRWFSRPGQSLLMSVVLRPGISAEKMGLITLSSALAVADTIEHLISVKTRIKWPNDVVIGTRKVSGILLESAHRANGDNPEFVVVGIGVNISQREFPDELSDGATSLLLESGRKISRDEVRDGILGALSRFLDVLTTEGGDTLRQAYEERLVGLHEPVALRSTEDMSPVEGILRGIGADGEIIIETTDGVRRPFYAGVTTSSSL